MKVRMKSDPNGVFHSSKFNTHAMSEVIGQGDSFGADSFFIKDLDVLLSTGQWKDMKQAFRDRDIITDNYNTWFFEPKTKADRDRGYTL